MSKDILYLCHRPPFPPDRGDKIRSHHVLKSIAQRARVHVGCLSDDHKDAEQEGQMAHFVASYWMPARAVPLPLAAMSAMLSGKPVSLAAFHDASLRQWVETTIAAHAIEMIYVFSGQMGQYIPSDFTGRVVLDLVDVDSAKFEAYARQSRGLKQWVYRREGRLLKEVERKLVARADTTLLVSESEAQLLRERVGNVGAIRAMCNGIDCERYDPATRSAQKSPYAKEAISFVFTGQMDYPPNSEAVIRFARDILPAIRQEEPAAQFHIVGRKPPPHVRRLGDSAGVTVHGEVADMLPYLAHAHFIVAPLTIARGVQNKVLEAMAMAKPVLLSPEAATGIDAKNAEHFLVCARNADFVEAALSLIDWPEDAATLGRNARRFVCERMDWQSVLSVLPEILNATPHSEHQRHAA